MTSIIAVKEKGIMYMASDRAISCMERTYTSSYPKMYRTSTAIVGHAGDSRLIARMEQEFKWRLPVRKTMSTAKMQSMFADEVCVEMRSFLRDAVDADDDDFIGNKFAVDTLLVYAGRIITIDNCTDVRISSKNAECIGCGLNADLIYSATSGSDLSVPARLRKTLKIISDAMPTTVGPPFDVMELKK